MFWTWLWGTLGLLLSTPMTVCLAVLGKYIPGLGFFAVLLGEEAVLEPDVRFYQRLVALDSDGATEIIEATLEQRSRAELFDEVLVPALTRAERDYARDELDDRDRAFIWRVIAEVLNELEGRSDQVSPTAALASPAGADQPPLSAKVLGIAANDTPDALVLRMLAQLLNPAGCAHGDRHRHRVPLDAHRGGGWARSGLGGHFAPAAGGIAIGPLPRETASRPVRAPPDPGRPLGRFRRHGRRHPRANC